MAEPKQSCGVVEKPATDAARVDLRAPWKLHARKAVRLTAAVGRKVFAWAASGEGRQWLSLGFILGCFAFLSLRVQRSELRQERYVLARQQLQLAWPDYVGRLPRTQLQGSEAELLAPFNRGSLPGLVSELAGLPWLASVDRAAWHFPHELELKLSLRVPFAWVAMRRDRVLIDRHGHLLPLNAYQRAVLDKAALPQLVGVPDAELPLPGQHWESSHIQRGLAFLCLLDQAGHPEYLRDAIVDVSQVGHSNVAWEIFFEPQGLPRVAYGRSPADPRWQLPDDKLLRDLELLFESVRVDPHIFDGIAEIRLVPGQPMVSLPQGG